MLLVSMFLMQIRKLNPIIVLVFHLFVCKSIISLTPTSTAIPSKTTTTTLPKTTTSQPISFSNASIDKRAEELSNLYVFDRTEQANCLNNRLILQCLWYGNKVEEVKRANKTEVSRQYKKRFNNQNCCQLINENCGNELKCNLFVKSQNLCQWNVNEGDLKKLQALDASCDSKLLRLDKANRCMPKLEDDDDDDLEHPDDLESRSALLFDDDYSVHPDMPSEWNLDDIDLDYEHPDHNKHETRVRLTRAVKSSLSKLPNLNKTTNETITTTAQPKTTASIVMTDPDSGEDMISTVSSNTTTTTAETTTTGAFETSTTKIPAVLRGRRVDSRLLSSIKPKQVSSTATTDDESTTTSAQKKPTTKKAVKVTNKAPVKTTLLPKRTMVSLSATPTLARTTLIPARNSSRKQMTPAPTTKSIKTRTTSTLKIKTTTLKSRTTQVTKSTTRMLKTTIKILKTTTTTLLKTTTTKPFLIKSLSCEVEDKDLEQIKESLIPNSMPYSQLYQCAMDFISISLHLDDKICCKKFKICKKQSTNKLVNAKNKKKNFNFVNEKQKFVFKKSKVCV